MPKGHDNVPGEDDYASRTIFVNGLAYESTEEDLEKFFEKCGNIEKINLPKYQDSNRNIGYGHVTFETHEEAKQAIKLNGEYLEKRYLKLEWSKGFRTQNMSKMFSDTISTKSCLDNQALFQDFSFKFEMVGSDLSVVFVFIHQF